MTKENSKKLYDHYIEIGKTDAAQNMLAKYPEFAEKTKAEPSEKKEKPKKSD
jgi:hypothetical protein